MKKIASLAAVLLVAAGIVTSQYPAEIERLAVKATESSQVAWSKIEANPIPIVVALGTFVLTFVYHKAKGKSFRESVEVAATRVTVVAPASQPTAPLNPVLKRAQARATRTQLLAEQIEIRNRIAKLPDAVVKAEKEACFAEKAVFDAKVILGEKHKTRNVAETKLNSLRAELTTGTDEIDAIEAELKKLADVL